MNMVYRYVIYYHKSTISVNKNSVEIYLFFRKDDEITIKFFMRHMKIYTTPRLKDKWGYKFTHCNSCKKKSKPHYAKGLCESCYQKAYREFHKLFKSESTN